MRQTLSVVEFVCNVFGVLLALLVLLSVLIGVVDRYFLNAPNEWSDAVASDGFAWLTIIGASAAVWSDSNLGVSYFRELPTSHIVRSILQAFAELMTAVFGFLFFRSGVALMQATSGSDVAGLGVPYPVVYSVTVGAGILMILFAIGRLLRRVSGPFQRDSAAPVDA